MSTQKDDLTNQVNGVTDVFNTLEPYLPGTLMLGYNGQIYPVGVNIVQEVTTTSFRISFTPEVDCTDALHVIYEDANSVTMMASGHPPGVC